MRNLEARHYTDPGIHAADIDRIFARTWQLVGPASRLKTRVRGRHVGFLGAGIVYGESS